MTGWMDSLTDQPQVKTMIPIITLRFILIDDTPETQVQRYPPTPRIVPTFIAEALKLGLDFFPALGKNMERPTAWIIL